MTDDFKREIERLLDEAGEGASAPPDRLRARLSATFSQALDETARTSVDAANPATAAAYLDGTLTGAAREKFAAALAQQPSLRADLEQAADIVTSVAGQQVGVPKALLARANAAFAPAPPRPAERAGWSLSTALASLLPRQRLALAAVAAAALLIAVPAGLIVTGKIGKSGGEPELSGVEDPKDEVAKRVQECREKLAKDAKDKSAGMSKEVVKDTARKDGKDPCDPANFKDGAKK